MTKRIKFGVNSCEGIYTNSIDVRYTGDCCNFCAHCIDKTTVKNTGKMNTELVTKKIIENSKGAKGVFILGGEPCLYLKELIRTAEAVKKDCPNLVFHVTTSLPLDVYEHIDEFNYLISLCDRVNVSVQHYKQEKAEEILGNKYGYDREELLRKIIEKDKIRICCNLIKDGYKTKEEIIKHLEYFDNLGFTLFKLGELQNAEKYYASYEEIMGIKMGSPFATGCQTNEVFNVNGKEISVVLKRSCFWMEKSKYAGFFDLLKHIYVKFKTRKMKSEFKLILEDGTVRENWC